ncbi:MAG: regulatory protein RecX [Gammaproteobacteria bacterium]|nr:regulatory protein RecX [Gammaproteobacteria bacterium]
MATDARQSGLTETALTECALRLLTRREHSRFELRRKLLRRRAGESESDSRNAAAGETREGRVAAVLDDLADRGLLSDERFVDSFVRRGVDRGHGPLKIRAGLRSRGVAEDLIDGALTFSDDFWLDLARAAQAKRFGDGGRQRSSNSGEDDADGAPSNRSEWARHARFLAARGFASDIIYRTLGPQTV